MVQNANRVARLRHSDTWIGLALVLVGVMAALKASGFDAPSRGYPMVLGAVLAAFGVVMIGKVMIGKARHVCFSLPAQAALTVAVIVMLWIGALTIGLGYVLPTFAMQFAFLLRCGGRGPGRAAAIAALITGVSYLVFILGLGVRIPEVIVPWLL